MASAVTPLDTLKIVSIMTDAKKICSETGIVEAGFDALCARAEHEWNDHNIALAKDCE